MYVRLDLILEAIGFPKETSYYAWKGELCLLPFIFLYNFNEPMRLILMCQGKMKIFPWMSLVQYILLYPMAYLFMTYLKLDIVGYGLFRFMIEIPYTPVL